MSGKEFPAGYVFYHRGDPADRAYQLLEGQVEFLSEADGETARVRQFYPGDVFGEMALVEERPRRLTARAVTAGRATSITRGEFEQLLVDDPVQARLYLRTLFERLRLLAAASAGQAEFESEEEAPAELPSLSELPTSAATTSDCVVVIHPLTHKAAETLPEEGLLVSRFPLRIGRASGVEEPEAMDLNDLWLLDEKPYHVSRNHCEIDVDRDGAIVCDRGSHLGCIVNDGRIGGRAGAGLARLELGENVLVVGSPMSKYQFRVTVSRR